MSAGSRWALFERFDIRDAEGSLYLRRWRVFSTPWFGVFVHKIVRPDNDRELHDHPWPFVSFVLRGGYVEQVPCRPCVDCEVDRHVRLFNAKLATSRHRITWLYRVPTWTLVLHGPRIREWGFYTRDGWVQWQEFIEQRERARSAA